MKNRPAVVGLLLIALIVVALGALAALNWDRLGGELAGRSEQARLTLFRAGELVSIAARLEERYATRPATTYETLAGERVLTIEFGERPPQPATTVDALAREIAVDALAATGKRDQVDAVVVRLGARFRFEREALDSEIRGGGAP